MIEQPKTVKENIASKLDEILQTALDFGAAKEDIVEAIDFIMENTAEKGHGMNNKNQKYRYQSILRYRQALRRSELISK